MSTPAGTLRVLSSIKARFGLLVAGSVAVAAILGQVSADAGVAPWLAIPVSILLALGVTQLLATGMTSPLREMTDAARRMSRGDYDVRVPDQSGDEIGALGRAFNTMAEDLARADRQRRDLVATVSHELRTPLTGMVAVLDNLADGVTPPDRDAIGSALHQAERLSRLVRDLLDLSKIEAGVIPLARDEVAVAALLDAAVTEARLLERPVSYAVEVRPPDLRVAADQARVHQLVANLLDNASRHTPSGGTVLVRALADQDTDGAGSQWVLEVDNPGDPIVAAERERVFEQFGRGSDPTGGGTGLGLAIARWITTLHGGTIAVLDPEPGPRGVRLRAVLPRVAPTQQLPHAQINNQSQPTSVQEPTMTSPTTSPATLPPSTPPPSPPPPPPSDALADLTGGAWTNAAPGRPGLLGGALLTGLLAAFLVIDQQAGLGYVLTLLTGGAVVFAASRNRREPFTLACAGLAAALVSVLMWRDAEWLGVLCTLAATALCVWGSTGARSFLGMLLSGVLWPFSALHGIPWLGRTLRAVAGGGNVIALLRTITLSVLLTGVFVWLLASADPLFGSWTDRLVPDSGVDLIVGRVFVATAVGGLVLATAYFALNPPRVERETAAVRRPVRQRYEWLAPVMLVNLVLLGFLAAQSAAAIGGDDYVQRTTGLTYAEYVHSGFGQLTFVTVLTLLVVWAAARKAPTETSADRVWLRGALGLLCTLTLAVVVSALIRMDAYQDAYGLTRLRVLVDTFQLWIALVLVAVLIAGIRLRGGWLPRLAVLSGSAMLLGLALVNPDAWIARHNLDRFERTDSLDANYLAGLSADATPALAAAPAAVRDCTLQIARPRDDDWLEWNLARARAVRSVRGLTLGDADCSRFAHDQPAPSSTTPPVPATPEQPDGLDGTD